MPAGLIEQARDIAGCSVYGCPMTDTLARATIVLTVNGAAVATAARTLAELLASLGHDAGSVATAVNGEFVPRAGRSAAALVAGDRIEVVSPRQGG